MNPAAAPMDLDIGAGLDLVEAGPGVGLGTSCFPPPPSTTTTQPNGYHSLAIGDNAPKPSSSKDSSLFPQLVWPAGLNPFANPNQSIDPSTRPPVPRACPPGLTIDVSAAALLSSSSRGSLSSSSGGASASAASSRFSLWPCFSATGSVSSAFASPVSAGSGVSPRAGARPKKPSMSGRVSAKRPVERGESSGDDSPAQSASGSQNGTKSKLARVERGTEDFSSVVKNRLQSYTRTGQACDRCKVRKIRCDALPEGCSHCINLNLECFVTDRVSGRTERRGYMQELERDKNGMVSHIRQLEKLLLQNGVQVKPWQEESEAPESPANEPPQVTEWAKVGSLWVKNYAQKSSYSPRFPRNKLESRSESRGTAAGRTVAPLNSMRGTKFTFLGSTVDTSSFPVPDVDEPEDPTDTTPLYNKSCSAFYQTTSNVNRSIEVELPPREEAFKYAHWYFMTVSVFVPVVHQPTFMTLLEKIYDDPEFQPTAAQLVQVHMIISTMLFQYAVRNWQQADQRYHLNDLSNKHFHFALSKWNQLLLSRELEAIQALALIASHVRQFPKVGCGAIVIHAVLQRAIEFDLHRNVLKDGEKTNLTNEMRKRIWWCILMAAISLTGRRGYPVPIAVEEMDVEFPEPVADELLTDEGVDTSRTVPCPFEAAIAGFKITPIFMEIFSNIHSVRGDPSNYVNVVKALEEQVKQWESELPDSLRLSDDATQDIQMAPLFMRTFVLECRLSLRHPGLAMTTDKKMMADNTRICAETGREFLHVAQKLQKIKCLDTTWFTVSFSFACIFCMLVAQWEKRFETTEEEFATLQQEMASWMSILDDTGAILDTKTSITEEIRRIMERTLAWIRHDMDHKEDEKKKSTKSTSGKGTSLPKSQPRGRKRAESLPRKQAQKPSPQHIDEKPRALSHAVPATQPQPQPQPQPPAQPPSQAQARSQQVAQAAVPEMMVPDPADTANKGYYSDQPMAAQQAYQSMAYDTTHHQNMDQTGYQTEASLLYNNSANNTIPMTEPAPNNPLVVFASQATQHMPPHSEAEYMWHARGNTWQDWTTAVADTSDRYSANALLTLGGGAMQHQSNPHIDSSFIVANDHSLGQPGGGVHHSSQSGQQWPMMIFDHNNNSATSG